MEAIKNNPVRLAGFAAAIVGGLVALGVPIPAQHQELATCLLAVVLPVAATEIARRFSWGPVTVAKLQAAAAKAAEK